MAAIVRPRESKVMSLYKRGHVYWYEFVFQGERHRGSTHLRNERKAEQFETKLKTDLALGLVGLTALKPGPRFDKYAEQFREFVRVRNAKHPATISFYLEKLERLLEYKPLAECRLNHIDENLINEYVQHRRKKVSVVSTNRELATLRRALRVAWKIHKLIVRVPTIQLLSGEVERDFVLTYDQEKAYLAVAENPLHDFAVLSLDEGLRIGEGVRLEWTDISFEPAHGARLGSIHIREGGPKKAERTLSMTPRVKAMLELRRRFLPEAKFVFPGRRKGRHFLESSLEHQHVRARKKAKVKDEDGTVTKLPKEFVIHSFRHTFGTRLGESGPDADAFTIMKIMGHSSITVSQKYVHPTPERMERAFERLDAMNEILRGDPEAERKLGVPPKSPHPSKRRL